MPNIQFIKRVEDRPIAPRLIERIEDVSCLSHAFTAFARVPRQLALGVQHDRRTAPAMNQRRDDDARPFARA